MAPFSTPILDSFTRADEDPIANGWTRAMPAGSSLPGLRVVSNQLAAGTVSTSTSEYTTAFGPDCEVYATITALGTPDGGTNYIFARKATAGGPDANFDVYMTRWFNSSGVGNDLMWLIRDDDAADTILAGPFSMELAIGDGVGLRCIGTKISCWLRQGGIWTMKGEVTDATYQAAGYFGAVMEPDGSRLDDYGGGNVPFSGADFAWPQSRQPMPMVGVPDQDTIMRMWSRSAGGS